MSGIDLCVWDRCNNKCVMCTNPDRPWPAWDGSFDYDYEAIMARLTRDKDRIAAAESIYLTGGEPTLHPRFSDLLDFLVENFPEQRIKLLTNGRAFFYEDFAAKILEKAPRLEIELSLHGPGPEIHDKITRAEGSFVQSARGLKNLLQNRKEQKISVRTVLGKFSYKHIKKTLGFLVGNFPDLDRVVVLFPEIEGQGLKNLGLTRPTYAQAKPYLEKCADFLPFFREIRFYHFPLCALPQNFWPHVWRTLPEEEVDFSETCRICRAREFCLGVHKGYLKDADSSEFRPITRRIRVQKPADPHAPIKLK